MKNPEVAKSVRYHCNLICLSLNFIVIVHSQFWHSAANVCYVRWSYKKTADSLESLRRVFSI